MIDQYHDRHIIEGPSSHLIIDYQSLSFPSHHRSSIPINPSTYRIIGHQSIATSSISDRHHFHMTVNTSYTSLVVFWPLINLRINKKPFLPIAIIYFACDAIVNELLPPKLNHAFRYKFRLFSQKKQRQHQQHKFIHTRKLCGAIQATFP